MRRTALAAAVLSLTAAVSGAAIPTASAAAPKAHTVRVAPTSDAASSAVVSKNGRYVAYQTGSEATSAPRQATQIVLWNAATRTKTVVSATDGVAFSGDSRAPSISPDGRYIAYVTSAPEIVGPGAADAVVLWDRTTHATTVVAAPSATTRYDPPHVSRGGRFVAYGTVPREDDDGGDVHTYLWSSATGTTRLVDSADTTSSVYPQDISDDGRYVLLASFADPEGDGRSVLWDRRTGHTQSVGAQVDAKISGDGRYVARNVLHTSRDRLRVPAIWNRHTHKTSRLHLPARFRSLTRYGATVSAISDTGRYVTVITNGGSDKRDQLLLVDRHTGAVRLVSLTRSGARAVGVASSAVSSKATTLVFTDSSNSYGTGGLWARLTHH